MPNWCENQVTITGSKEKVWSLIDAVVGDESDEHGVLVFDFNKIIPMPEELKGTRSPSEPDDPDALRRMDKYGASNWYDWCIANWDTKWDASDPSMEVIEPEEPEAEHVITRYIFNTAWSPPTKVIAALSEQHPDVVIHHRYEEEGMGYIGMMMFRKGAVLQEFNFNMHPRVLDYDEYEAWQALKDEEKE